MFTKKSEKERRKRKESLKHLTEKGSPEVAIYEKSETEDVRNTNSEENEESFGENYFLDV